MHPQEKVFTTADHLDLSMEYASYRSKAEDLAAMQGELVLKLQNLVRLQAKKITDLERELKTYLQ